MQASDNAKQQRLFRNEPLLALFPLRVQKEDAYLHPDLEFVCILIANDDYTDKFLCFWHILRMFFGVNETLVACTNGMLQK